MIDTVIFDMDGLLINSEPLWMRAMQEVMETVDVHITPEMALATTGLRTSEVLEYWYARLQWKGKSAEQVGDEIIENVCHKVTTEGTLMEGQAEAMDFCRRKGLKIGLASSSPLHFIETALRHFGIRDQFEVVQSAEFEAYGKPHPAVYLSCAQALGSAPLNCLAFEDSINGMIAAKAARMKVVAVPEPHHRPNPRFVLADKKLDSLLQFDEEVWKELV